ncbi:MAG: SRPBCC domain-containing protein [Acidobacteriia bacterium]|nr:SRPBCC domain-containing protein [Terriglobia bacterium]
MVLFRAWTRPSIMKEWFHTGSEWTTPAAEIDLRVGGHYRVAMQDAAGKIYSYRGRYQDIREPRSLAFTWAPYGDPAIETLVVLQFRPGLAGSNTELKLSHLGLLHEQMRDDHEAIWNICLDRLEETL